MASVSTTFRELDEKLKLDPGVHRKAKGIRDEIDNVLSGDSLIASSLLQGSYGRKTMRPRLKDVDLVILASDEGGKDHRGNWSIGAFVDRVRWSIDRSGSFSGVTFDEGGASPRALKLALPGVDFTVDLVPARESSDPDWLLLGDREDGTWDFRSDVRALRDKVAARNQLCGGRWVRQVRMSKSVLSGDKLVDGLVCGLLVESAAFDVVADHRTDQRAVASTLGRVAAATQAPYRGLGQKDLTKAWTDVERAQVVEFFRDLSLIHI